MNRPDVTGTQAPRTVPASNRTTSIHAPGERVLVEEWAEEFLDRRRRGERPTVDEYVDAHPERADEIRELFAAVVLIEDLRPRSDDESARLGGFRLLRGDRPIERLGDYHLLREIGRGGMGVVYEAEQESLGRRVALKVLAPWSRPNASQVQRFHREARAAAQLHHTNIVPVFGVGESEGLHYYAMQYIQGLGLDAVIEEVRRLQGQPPVDESIADDRAPATPGIKAISATEVARSLLQSEFGEADASEAAPEIVCPELHQGRPRHWLVAGIAGSTELSLDTDSTRAYCRSIARIGLQVAEALAYAHEQGTLHRDIKPSNLLLDGHGIVWVSDFGLAKSTDDVDLTRTGDLVGTVRYMAPERFQGKCDPRADVYSLGLTLYELLAYRPAFEDSDRHSLIHRIGHAYPERLRKVNPSVPRDLETIIHKAIEKSPASRYGSARLLADDLRRLLEGRPIRARRTSLAERSVRWARRNPGHAALGATVLLLMMAIALISSVAALRLGHKHEAAMSYLRDAELARTEARRQLWDSYLAQARASRLSGRAGRRFDGLRVLGAASAMGLHPQRVKELRDEAIACLALSDLREVEVLDDLELVVDRPVTTFSADGDRLALGYADGTIRVIDRSDGHEIRVLKGPEGRIGTLRFSPDGTRLAAKFDQGGRGLLSLWDLDVPGSDPLVMSPEGIQGDAYDFSPDGNWLAVAAPSGRTDLLDPSTGNSAAHWDVRPVPDLLKFDPRGERLALSRLLPHAAITIHDAVSGSLVTEVDSPQVDRGMSWSPDGRHLAVACDDRRIRIFDLNDRSTPPRVLEGHQGQVISVDYHPSGDLLASGSWDGMVQLWDARSGLRLLGAPSPEGWHVRFTRDGRHLGHGREGSRIFLWEIATGAEARVVTGRDGGGQGTWSAAFHPDGPLFASAGGDVVRLDQLGHGELTSIRMPGAQGAEFLPDGSAMITGGEPGLLLWPIARGDGASSITIGPPRPIGPDPGQPTRRFCLSADGAMLVVLTPSNSGRIVAFPIDAPERAMVFRGHPGAERVAISPDGRWVATGTWKGADVKVWDLRAGTLAATLPVLRSAEVRFSPDGSLLISGSGGEYQFWDVGTWRPSGPRIVRHDSGELPGKISFARDGSLLAVTRSRSLVALVEPRSGRELATLESSDSKLVASIEFDPTGETLAVTYNDDQVRYWNLASIRASLRAMGLDWEPAEGPPPRERAPMVSPVPVKVVLPTWMTLSREAEEHVLRGDLTSASEAYEGAIRAGARDPLTLYRAAVLRLALGDLDGYRRSCRALIDAYRGVDDLSIVNWLAWTSVLGPDAPGSFDALLDVARWIVRVDDRAYAWNTLGAALVRAGRPDEAITALDRAMALDGEGTSLDVLFLALAHDANGAPDRARGYFEQAEALLHHELGYSKGTRPAIHSAFTQIEHDILYREVEERLAEPAGATPD